MSNRRYMLKKLCAKEGSRANFFQSVAEEMVNVNAKWAMYQSNENDFAEDDTGADYDTTPKVLNLGNCVPTSLEVIPAKIGTKMKSCQVSTMVPDYVQTFVRVEKNVNQN
jgi:hypothetical protein